MANLSQNKEKWQNFTEDDLNRMVRMGWEDRTTFDSIQIQFGLTPNEFVQFMRSQLDKKAFIRWRKRTHKRGHLKHSKIRGNDINRFKCSRQSIDGITKGWK
jgi:uncharacterized protein (TIGR03643 family)